MSEESEVGVGLLGYKLMGRAHSNAYRQVARFFGVRPVLGIRTGQSPAPIFEDGYRCQAVSGASRAASGRR